MKLHLSHEQAAELKSFLRPGITLLARINRETFDGTNPGTSGSPFIEFGPVPSASLPALREAILEATNPTPKPTRRKTIPPQAV